VSNHEARTYSGADRSVRLDDGEMNFEVLKVGDTFVVRVDYPNGNGAIRRGFLTAAEAAEWIRQQGGQPMPPPS
jgi:hypothetical protein